jgi:ribosomal protein L11 methyltransferase
MAEAVADVLARYIPSGVVIESTQISPDPDGEGHVIGPLRVCGYLDASTDIEDARRRIEEGLWYLGRIAPLPAPQFRIIQEVNWVETWKQHYHPIPVGDRLVIIPAWLPDQQDQRIPIRIDPGMAFGTGTHPTTQLCLAMAERYTRKGQPVIDVGCGSGILAIASLKLGASTALGVDIEAEAIESARQNADLNRVLEDIELALGSVTEVRQGAFGVRQAPLVFANILAPILIRLFTDGLGDLVSAGGVLVLSGILAEQEDGVMAAAQDHGFTLESRLQIGDWVTLAVIRSVS